MTVDIERLLVWRAAESRTELTSADGSRSLITINRSPCYLVQADGGALDGQVFGRFQSADAAMVFAMQSGCTVINES